MRKSTTQKTTIKTTATLTGLTFWAWSIITLIYSTNSLAFLPDIKSPLNQTKSITAIYSPIGEGDSTHCIISSNDRPEALQQLKKSQCNLSDSASNDHYVLLTVRDGREELRTFLIQTRQILNWAYMAIHIWKFADSGYKLINPPICPCSGMPKSRSPISTFFFSYYFLSLAHHSWDYISSYFYPDNSKHPPVQSIENNNATENDLIHTLKEQLYSGHLLTLALDAAALRLDCQCGGYFSDAQGNFYFNGHLWMLMLNMGIFATDLALEYL
ncbi:hypothetical protein [Endozoicomonas ascidiicola]|uniref:hypothetical protein n=1 Tax=Endozoicomonas ascidiicola TaxID=1698521 RepID=UPI00082AC854|nr:hypothetical protein [Endozoicomonas ascidiicola]